jgi:trehalose 6-phosphate phosphatase
VLLPGVRALLEQALDVFDVVAAVSGRSAVDARRLVGVPGITYIGNHGFERLTPDGMRVILPAAVSFQRPIASLLRQIERTLASRFPGLRVEPKGVTGSIHLRNTSDPAAAEEAVYAAAVAGGRAHDLRVTRGKLVVELRPPVEVDKGVAMEEVIRGQGLRGAFYVGDDRTDVDAFRALRRLTVEGACHGVAVAVLHEEAPPELAGEADLALPSIEVVPIFLRWLLSSAP